jgi:hypothetical protein
VNTAPLTFTVPVRPDDAVFGATVNATEPLPLPAVAARVIHGTALFAVQAQPGFVTIPIEPAPPAAAKDVEDCCSVTVHGAGGGAPATAAWAIVITRDPTVTLPVRAAPALADTEKETVAVPEPADGDRAIHPTSLVAVHGHPAATPTVMVPPPPDAEKLVVFAVAVTSHAAALWRIAARCPLTLMALSREVPVGFGTARNCTWPFP